ncbi:hypothetical protein LXL04_006755 [Taraxacum kok-saghyz]
MVVVGRLMKYTEEFTSKGIKDESSHGTGHVFTNIKTLGGIKEGPSPGIGHKVVNDESFGNLKTSEGIKDESSHGTGHVFTNIKTLGGIKEGPSPGIGHKVVNDESFGNLKTSEYSKLDDHKTENTQKKERAKAKLSIQNSQKPSETMGSSKDDSATDGDKSTGNRRRPDSNSNLFSDGEKVLAFHGPRIYEAKAFLIFSFSTLKVQKAEIRKNEWKYFVHYLLQYLDNSWDEWVGVDRLMKYSEENVLKQKALDKKQGVDKNSKSGKSTQTKPKVSNDVKVEKEDVKSSGAKGKKRKSDSSIEKENASVEKPVKIQIPSSLKKQLVDDWEFINHQDKLVKLPRSPNVDDILAKYLEYRSKKDGMMTDAVSEILKGLRCYFDRALPVILLYNKERKQFQELITDNISPSTIYGAEHLLRLFVKLPELLPYVNIEEDLAMRLQQKFIDFLKFLQKNQTTFFNSSYDGLKVSDRGKMVQE